MKLIKPAEISAKIMTLIDEAETDLIIVSPYNNISNWNKLIIRINKAKARGVKILWYSRKNNVNQENAEEVRQNLGIEPILIDDLHAKIYMNETYAVVASMNMSKVSDDKSIEIGYLTQTDDEYSELLNVFNKHIKEASGQSIQNTTWPVLKGGWVLKTKQTEKIGKDLKYINSIHAAVFSKYGEHDFNYSRDSFLEYLSFPKRGFKTQFVPFNASIRIQIFAPDKETLNSLYEKISQDENINKLSECKELKLIDDRNGNFIKYFYTDFMNLNDWEEIDIADFLQDMTILFDIVRSHV